MDFATRQPRSRGLLGEDELTLAVQSVGYSDPLKMARITVHLAKDRQGNIDAKAFVDKCYSAHPSTTPNATPRPGVVPAPQVSEDELFKEAISFHILVALRDKRQKLDSLLRAFPNPGQVSQNDYRMVLGQQLQLELSEVQTQKIAGFAGDVNTFRSVFFESRKLDAYFRNLFGYAGAMLLTEGGGNLDRAFMSYQRNGRVEVYQFRTILMKYDQSLSEGQLDQAWGLALAGQQQQQVPGQPPQQLNFLDQNGFRRVFAPAKQQPDFFDAWVPNFLKSIMLARINLLKPRLTALDPAGTGLIGRRNFICLLQIVAADGGYALSDPEATQLLRFAPRQLGPVTPPGRSDADNLFDYRRFLRRLESEEHSSPLSSDEQAVLKNSCLELQRSLEAARGPGADLRALLNEMKGGRPEELIPANQLASALAGALQLQQDQLGRLFYAPGTSLFLLVSIDSFGRVDLGELAQEFDRCLGVTAVTVDGEATGVGRTRSNIQEFNAVNPLNGMKFPQGNAGVQAIADALNRE